MPNPPFQPLTLSVEEWARHCERKQIRVDEHSPWLPCDVSVLADELTAQAQEAASLRQRLEEAEKALVKLTADIPKAEKRLEQTAAKHALRASQAEAALADIAELIDQSGKSVSTADLEDVLQRRRSALGQEKA